MIRYSFLISKQSQLHDIDYIGSLLSQGIKVIAFGCEEDLTTLKEQYAIYIQSRLLQLYEVCQSVPELIIADGTLDNNEKKKLIALSEIATSFNIEQYLIEHADYESSLFVEAGAGTGKTTVMIDRVMFLLHMVPKLTMEEIGMITFTNEATQNMKHKIQSALMQRYLATKNPRYLRFLEDSSKLHIQTIHSFSKSIINDLGTSIGYAQEISLRSFNYQKKQLIHDVLDDLYIHNRTKLRISLGGQLYELEKLILNFWTQLQNLGLTDEEILRLDWGEPVNADSRALHDTLRLAFVELNKRYNELKLEEDSIDVGDIVKELRRILDRGNEVNLKQVKLKYLFVDEFQDSDNSQIRAIAWLQKMCNLKLFAVGDTKQSIYRFRGAVETAFDKLRLYISENNDVLPLEFSLSRNYRTSSDVLNALEPKFRKLERKGLLDYGKSLAPQKNHPGVCNFKHVYYNNKVIRDETINTIKDTLADCLRYSTAAGNEDNPNQHVTALVRTNYQLRTIAGWCEEVGIPCYIRQEGTFYESQAVRDFFCMVKAYVFPSSSIQLFDYINSAYVSSKCPIDEVSIFSAGSVDQLVFLWEKLEPSGWAEYHRLFRLNPVMAVLRQIVDERKPTEQFISMRKAQLIAENKWEDEELSRQLSIEANQYDANLDKLFHILRKHFSGQMTSLYQIYSFLKLSISTNSSEDEPDISEGMGCGCLYGMTVHKAKGLEFDTVLVPFTNRVFRKDIDTELILDETATPNRVGWSKLSTINDKTEQYCNN